VIWTHVFAISIIVLFYGLFFLGGIKHLHKLEQKKEGEENESK
jgi:hypothetical protein